MLLLLNAGVSKTLPGVFSILKLSKFRPVLNFAPKCPLHFKNVPKLYWRILTRLKSLFSSSLFVSRYGLSFPNPKKFLAKLGLLYPASIFRFHLFIKFANSPE